MGSVRFEDEDETEDDSEKAPLPARIGDDRFVRARRKEPAKPHADSAARAPGNLGGKK